MNPFYFGTAERPLYGAYHPPRTRGGRPEGVVLCYPVHVEYMRAHRAFRQLTSLLTRRGLHVLRFDYFGTGDSAGEGEEATVEEWERNVGTAIRELRDTAGLEEVILVGLRLGATLAYRAARGRDDLARLVLWDPIVTGEDYLSELLRRPARQGFEGGGGVMGVRGYPVSKPLFDGLLGVELDREEVPEGVAVDLVVSHESDAFERLRQRIEASGTPVALEVVPSDSDWGEGDEFGSALIPGDIVQRIVERTAGPEAIHR